MQPSTIETAINWLTLLTLIAAIIGSVGIVATAVYQSLKARAVRWDVLIFIVVLLWSLPYGIRNYGPELVDASIDLINSMSTKREPLEGAIRNLFGDTVHGETESTAMPESTLLPVFTATPSPTREINFEATATAFFADQPTAEPTPQPTPTPEPTRCTVLVNGTARPCPPTPQPGG